MKKMFLIMLLTLGVMMLVGCTENSRARTWGGTSTVELEPGQILDNATWKNNDLWLLTKKRPDSVSPSTYYFKESSSFGVMEGTIIIKEK